VRGDHAPESTHETAAVLVVAFVVTVVMVVLVRVMCAGS
jgi:hypothetical protein